jgi:hypothetical protein
MEGMIDLLRCERCEKPVLLLSPEQREQLAADPERFRYQCTDCDPEQ